MTYEMLDLEKLKKLGTSETLTEIEKATKSLTDIINDPKTKEAVAIVGFDTEDVGYILEGYADKVNKYVARVRSNGETKEKELVDYIVEAVEIYKIKKANDKISLSTSVEIISGEVSVKTLLDALKAKERGIPLTPELQKAIDEASKGRDLNKY